MSTENVFSLAISAEILDSLQCKREENSLTTCSRVFPSGGSRVPTVVTMGAIWERERGGEGGEEKEGRKGRMKGRGGKKGRGEKGGEKRENERERDREEGGEKGERRGERRGRGK